MPTLTGNQMNSENYQRHQTKVALDNLATQGICIASSFGASEMTNLSEEKKRPRNSKNASQWTSASSQ